MTCHDAIDFLDDYLDGRLPWRERVSFELHLTLCRSCRRYLDGYRKTMQLSREAFPESEAVSSEELPEELISAILASQSQGPRID